MPIQRGQSIRRTKQLVVSRGPEIVARYVAGENLFELADAYGIAPSTVRLVVIRSGGAVRKRGFGSRSIAGPNNPRWTGGAYVTGEGYRKIWIPEDHPMAVMRTSGGYVLEHRLVMAELLGRPLCDYETVHHVKTEDKLNNAPENLQLRIGQHGKGAHWKCLDCGSFNVHPQPLA